MARDTNSYDSPFYADLASSVEQKVGLPVGLLSSIVTKGERSNADQTSEAGAKTVFQIIPATRKAALEKYGIDAYLSPENAAEVAGRLLKDSLDRNNGDTKQAVGEYIGGTDRKNWGKVTQSYINRVMTGQQSKKIDAMSAGFARFMADNPAQGIAQQQPQAQEASKPDALAAGFGDWLKNGLPRNPADMIPMADGTYGYGQVQPVTQEAESTLGDKIIGAGETALSLASGATTGTLGMLGGTAKGLAQSVIDGSFGTAQGANAIEQAAGEGMEAGTYAPRTQSGQSQTGVVGDALMAVLPATALTAEMGAVGQAARGAAAGARDLSAGAVARAGQVASSAAQRVRQAAPEISARVDRILSRNPEPTPTPGTRGSAGAAGTDMATQRLEAADSLPVPLGDKLTEGMLTRDQQQLRFEQETAKGPEGQKIRDRYSDLNTGFEQNFEAFVDQTGKTTADATELGKMADDVLKKELTRDKTEVRSKYRAAEQSEESRAPVDPGETVSIGQGDNAINHSVISYLNSKPTGLSTTALTDHAKQYAIKLGVAAKAEDGSLVPLRSDVKTMEALRREISQATGYEPTSIRDSAILKGIIDAQTEPVAGALYRDARRARENLAKKWENRSVVADLVNNKRGMDDRRVAIEDVFKHIVLDSTRSELSHMRRVLQPAGEHGQQVWKELQGQTLEWMKAEATKNVATDQRGNRIWSPAQLDRAVTKLDSKGKLEFIFGKQGAQQIRDINDLAKVVFTTPPGTVNHSNTAGVIAAMLAEAGALGAATGLPVPIVSGARILVKHVKNQKLRARIERSLNASARRRVGPRPPQR